MPKGIKSLRGFVQRLEKLQEDQSLDYFFRGHSKKTYKQQPSVFRNPGHAANEKQMIYHIVSESPKEFESDQFAFDRLVRAQHYGIPTRLLDVTTNPLMALYFACCSSPTSRAQVIVYGVPKTKIKYSMSDAVSCAANLYHLNLEEKSDILGAAREAMRYIYGRVRKLPRLREEDEEKYFEFIEEFNEYSVVQRLVQFVREEKPYFRNEIDPWDLFNIHVVLSKKNNPRLVAQSGAFLTFGLADNYRQSIASDIEIEHIDVAAADKDNMLRSLDAVSVHENSVFPELEVSARRISAQYAEKQRA